MTVNHGVVGSSPTGGAKTKGRSHDLPFVLAFLFGFMPKLHLRRRRIMGEVACDLISERCLRANVVVRFKPGRGSQKKDGYESNRLFSTMCSASGT